MAKNSYPRVNFVWDVDTETDRLLITAHKTATGFFLSKGFYVLNRRIDGDASCVYLPEIDFKSYPDFWERVKQAEEQIPLENIPKKLIEYVREAVTPIARIDKSAIARFERSWIKIENDFWSSIYYSFPSFADQISEIEVRVTSFGTLSSYSHLNNSSTKMVAYLREDFGIEQLAEVIITTLYMKDRDYNNSHWELSEGVTDFLMTTSRLSKLFPKYVPTLESLRYDIAKFEQSNEYLNSIGVPAPVTLEIKNGSLFAGATCIETGFSKSQAGILKLLLNRKGQIVTYDDLAELIWEQNSADKFSIWAINKHIQRIKNKMADADIYSSHILPIRGRGYMLTQ